MCGIVGYIGKQNAVDILIDGLRKLEYRGYDSSGIAIVEHNEINVQKAEGKLANLQEKLKGYHLNSNIGIGHTRWATHGRPSDYNAHPHTSQNGRFAVVHNGIVENYLTLKETYLAREHFTSETDTEVVAHLLEKFYNGSFEETVVKVLDVLEGAYALVMVCADEPDKIIACRKDSPMVLGVGEGESFIASDVPALLAYTRKCMYIEKGELCVLTRDGITIKNHDLQPLEKEVHTIEWDAEAAEKDGFEHFMLKEIFEQPAVFHKTIAGRIHGGNVQFDEFELTAEQVQKWKKIYIVACGTAYHAGLVGKNVIEKLARIPVEVEIASEFRYRDPMLDEDTLVIVISQSGETADTVAALREAKKHGCKVMAITNVVGSAIARESDYVIYIWAGPEISVASTKAYTTMLIAEYLLGVYLAQQKGMPNAEERAAILEGLQQLPAVTEQVLTDDYLAQIRQAAETFKDANDIFFIGRGLDWAIALEGSLKLKEISYIHAEAYAAGELKHGTLALVTSQTPVIAICVQESTYDKTASNIKEVKARDASVLAIISEGDDQTQKFVDQTLAIPKINNFIAPVLAVIPLQLISYYTAKARGCEIDQPRNLAKSVTVE
ncbi:MAG: glutamine--fructose-6-phosphate transaminase (isomerizing) [Peptococcaceae bacterium]|nr:glutamine--fructose-6-phosphate transaminase (isomerizing) [Peptococcaceae bacterium]